MSSKKEKLPPNGGSFNMLIRSALHTSEAIAAVNGTISLRLKGNLSLATAICASSGKILSGTTSGILAGITAGLAALGFILETTLCVEFLLTGSKHKLVTAFFAH
jgi:hypothetical protein